MTIFLWCPSDIFSCKHFHNWQLHLERYLKVTTKPLMYSDLRIVWIKMHCHTESDIKPSQLHTNLKLALNLPISKMCVKNVCRSKTIPRSKCSAPAVHWQCLAVQYFSALQDFRSAYAASTLPHRNDGAVYPTLQWEVWIQRTKQGKRIKCMQRNQYTSYEVQYTAGVLQGRVQCTWEWSAMHLKRSVSLKYPEACTSVHRECTALRSGYPYSN